MLIIYLNRIYLRDGNICYVDSIWCMQNNMYTALVILYNHEKDKCTNDVHEAKKVLLLFF